MRATRQAREIHVGDLISRFSWFLSVSGSFQALIQYGDMLSAQTAKFVSILDFVFLHPSSLSSSHLFFPPSVRPLSSCFLSSTFPFSLFRLPFILFYFFFFISSSKHRRVARRCLSTVQLIILPRDRSKFSMEHWKNIFSAGKIFSNSYPCSVLARKLAVQRLITRSELDERVIKRLMAEENNFTRARRMQRDHAICTT